MSIGRGISAAVILSGGDRGWEGGGGKEVRQMERCGDCDMRSVAQVASHTLRTHSTVTRQEKKKRRAQSNCKAVNPRTILKVLRCFISCWSGRVSVCECVSVSYRRDSE